MPKKIEGKKINAVISVDVNEIFTRKVEASGTGAVIYFRKDYIGREVYVVVPRGKMKLK